MVPCASADLSARRPNLGQHRKLILENEHTCLSRSVGPCTKYGLGFLTRARGGPRGPGSYPWAFPGPPGGPQDLGQTKAKNLKELTEQWSCAWASFNTNDAPTHCLASCFSTQSVDNLSNTQSTQARPSAQEIEISKSCLLWLAACSYCRRPCNRLGFSYCSNGTLE